MRPVRCAQSVIDPGHSDTREAMHMTYKMPYGVRSELHKIDLSSGCSVKRAELHAGEHAGEHPEEHARKYAGEHPGKHAGEHAPKHVVCK